MNNILFLISVYEQLFLDYIDLNRDVLGDCFGIAYGKNEKTSSVNYKKVLFYSDHLSQTPQITKSEISALQKIEATCGISLADCIHSDRHLMKIKPDDRKNIAYQKVFSSIAKALNVNEPQKLASKTLLELAWKLEAIRCLIMRKNPSLTKETARTSYQENRYNNHKIKSQLGFEFHTLEEAILNTAKFILKFN